MIHDIRFSQFLHARRAIPEDVWGTQCWYVAHVLRQCAPPPDPLVAHFGSFDHGANRAYRGTYRDLLAELGFRGHYVGIDLIEGPGVDRVCNLRLCEDVARLKNEYPRGFDIIICTSTLEHDRNPGEFLGLMLEHLRDEGIAIFTAPATHRLHGTVGVYGHYQQLLPDFFWHYARTCGAEVLPESFLYVTCAEQSCYAVAAVPCHESPRPLVRDAQTSHPDYTNIPRIKDLLGNLRKERPWPVNRIVVGLAKALARLSPTFTRILRNNTCYFQGLLCVCITKCSGSVGVRAG